MATNHPSSLKPTPLTRQDARARWPPLATTAIIGITAIITSLQFLYPALLPALDRNLGALQAGQWWRLITPRFVQLDIWPQYLLLAVLAVVGPPVERRFGHWRWLVLWLVGGLTGEIVSFAWEPQGAGASVGIFGLMGAWLVLLLWRESEHAVIVAIFVFALLVNMLGLAVSTPVIAAVAATVVASLLNGVLRREELWLRFAPGLGGAGLLGGLILTLLRDQHGPPLLAGACMAAVLRAFIQKKGENDAKTNE